MTTFIALKVTAVSYTNALKYTVSVHVQALKQTIGTLVRHIVKILRDTKDEINQMFGRLKAQLQLVKSHHLNLLRSNLQMIKAEAVSRLIMVKLTLATYTNAFKTQSFYTCEGFETNYKCICCQHC